MTDHTRTAVASKRAGSAPSGMGFFATTLPGLGKMLRAEIAEVPSLDPVGEPGFDGRADIVFFGARRGADPGLSELRLAEDVFAIVGHARSGPPRRVAASLIRREGLERTLSTRARLGQPLRAAMSYRVIARVVDESRFKRTDLRDAVARTVAEHRPRWRIDDPAQIELWVLEHHRSRFVAGLRLSTKRMRQRGEGRAAERRGALRPVVAAAMVRLAGEPPGQLLDPYCGTGTIVAEALAIGWHACGSDIDEKAVAMARANVTGTTIEQADALNLPHDDASFDAIVANLPFGRQFRVDVDPKRWLASALREAARVTRPTGRVVILIPPSAPRSTKDLTLTESHPLRLLGVRTRIWVYQRTDAPPGNEGSMRDVRRV